MQPQINAIKQLFETNSAIAESIDQCIIKWAGESASWEQAATFKTAEEFNSETNPDAIDPVFKELWRSRVDLNDARINAEEVDLDSFLTHIAVGNSFNLVKANITLQKEIEERDKELNHSNKLVQDLRLQTELLKAQVNGLEAALELANNKAIAPNLEAFQEAVNNAVNPLLIEKLAERDRELERVNGLYKLLEAGHRIERNFAKTVRDKLDLDEWNTDEDVFEAIAKLREHHSGFVQSIKDALKGYRFVEEAEILDAITRLTKDYISMVDDLKKANEQNRQIQELQIFLKKYREQFDDLKLNFWITLKAINMDLNGLKGDRKPDEVKEVDGVMTRFRNYDKK